MSIRDRPTASRSPWQNGYTERVIGSICRECLDHVIVRNEVHLRRVLQAYTSFYNATRTHLGLQKDTHNRRPVERSGRIVTCDVLGGLHHQYSRIVFGRDSHMSARVCLVFCSNCCVTCRI
jgi:hypothetical protein